MSKPIVIRRASLADHERLQSLHRASLLGLASSHYDTAEIEAYIDYDSPMLGELIARCRYRVIEDRQID